jgi:hypothetical protein
MNSIFSLHETVEVEVNEAADFCDLEDPGLGNVFLDDVERAIAAISLWHNHPIQRIGICFASANALMAALVL